MQNPGEFAVDGPLVSVVPRAGTHTGKTLVVSFQRAAPPPTPLAARRPLQTISNRIESLIDRQAAGARASPGRADADGADARARRSAGRCRSPRCPRGWCRRCSRSKTAATTRIPASIPFAWSARCSRTCSATGRIWTAPARSRSSWRRNFFLTEEMAVEQQTRQRSLRAQAARAVHGGRPRSPGDQGRGARAVSERRLSGQARLVRRFTASPRRRASSSARTSAISRSARRPRSPASFSRPARCRRSTRRRARASAATSCCGRWPTPASSSAEAADARDQGAACRRSRARSKPRRRTSSTTSARRSREQFPGRDADDRGRRRLHDARPAPAAARAGRGRAAASPKSISCCRARRRGRVPRRRSSRSIRGPATSWRWSAAARTTSRSSTAPSARAGSPDRSSSRSSTSRRSSAPPRRAPTLTPATLVDDEPTTFDANGTPWTPANYENEYDGEITLRRALAHVAQRRDRQGRRGGRLRPRRRALEAHRRRHDAARVSVDRARRVRSDAVRDRDGLHDLPQRRRDARAAAAAADSARRHRRSSAKRLDHEARRARPTRRTSSPT